MAKEWRDTVQALKDVSVLVAVRTVRSLRESNALSAAHATRFIDIAIDDTVERLCDRDAELRKHWDAVRARIRVQAVQTMVNGLALTALTPSLRNRGGVDSALVSIGTELLGTADPAGA